MNPLKSPPWFAHPDLVVSLEEVPTDLAPILVLRVLFVRQTKMIGRGVGALFSPATGLISDQQQ